MNINLSVFAPKGKNASKNRTTVSFASHGLSISRSFFEKIGSPSFVVIAFDKENKWFGLRNANQSESDAFKVDCNSNPNGYTPRVNNVGLLYEVSSIIPYNYKTQNLEMRDYIIYDGFVCFDLNKAIVVEKQKRVKK